STFCCHVIPVYGCGPVIIRPNTTVANGDAEPHSWPWQVSLQYEKDGEYIHTCGGSLIHRFWVLTSAHCILPCRTYRIVLGVHSLSAPEDEVKIIAVKDGDIHIHEEWKRGCLTCGYDIALIKLSEEAGPSDNIQLGCLPAAGQLLTANHQCFITGWGQHKPGESVIVGVGYPDSEKLQQAELSFVKAATCIKPKYWDTTVKDIMICAGNVTHPGCIGDSGGPLNCINKKGVWEVHGITSFFSAEGCDAFNKPTVFTQVISYLVWINGIIASYS
uniref:Peptidase S1 domain-containing protein n=1 Tax=Leptobrachium leishanense TaxID=445787 RepID=A0A8C5MYQ4_9ANUR